MFRAALIFILLMAAAAAIAREYPGAALDPQVEYRYCGTPKRSPTTGDILRSAAVLSAFQAQHPCPANGATKGACPGWAINHVVPLACGGCDAVFNLQWLPVDIKACSGPHCIDRFERLIYAKSPPIEGTPACTRKLVP